MLYKYADCHIIYASIQKTYFGMLGRPGAELCAACAGRGNTRGMGPG